MKFAKYVCIAAGIWGIVVLTPLYWLVDITGRRYVVPVQYPHFYYGFISVAMAWQIGFLIIGSNPVRYRALLIPAVLEKVGYVAGLAVLYAKHRIAWVDAQAGGPDLTLGILFVLAFFTTRSKRSELEHDERQKVIGAVRDDRRPQRIGVLERETHHHTEDEHGGHRLRPHHAERQPAW